MIPIKIKASQIVLIVYLTALSILLKKIIIIQFVFLLILFIFDRHINQDLKNLLYLIIAITPFFPLLIIFLFYLPFAVYGLLFENSHFIKRYLFGFSLSLFSAAFVYIISILTDIAVNWQLLILAYYSPVMIIIYKIFKKHDGLKTLQSLYKIDVKELTILIISLLFLFYVAGYVVNEHNMYVSNGTYIFTKFLSVLDGLREFNEIPQYDQRIGQGEQLFLTDTPTFFSNLAFVNIILKWVSPILFFNSITLFIIWLSIMGAWLLIFSLLGNERDDYFLYIVAIIGAMSIILSFTFLQLFESFKQSSAFPYDFLALSMVFSGLKNPMQFVSAIAVAMASFLTHPTKSTGVILIAVFAFFLLLFSNSPKEHIRRAMLYSRENKLRLFLLVALLALLNVFYLFPGYYYKNYAREAHFPKIEEIRPISYVKDFFLDKNTNPLSAKYPDLRRVDDKKFGAFFSFFGLASLALIFFNFKRIYFKKTIFFTLAYTLHFAASSVITFIPPFGQAEYGYRTVLPFLLVVLVASIAAFVYNVKDKNLKIIMITIFFIGFMHSAFFVKQNLVNIHSEEMISGATFSNEINFVKQLPIDGRILTLGMYSNAVDTAMSVLTNHYFSRYGYLQWDFEDNIYNKLTTMNSFGVVETIEPLSSNEFANYLRLTGYKYLFLNICHPVGNLALKKIYPDNSYPLYQNPNNQCFVFLGVNNSNYAEKVDIVIYVNESMYKESNGYWYASFNRNKKIHNFDLNPHLSNVVDAPREPISLRFKRISPTRVEISGDFKKNDWVVFKEEYFPRWKAYMNGNEAPLLATNNRMMLIRTDEGNNVELVYSMANTEKLAMLSSLPAVVALIAIFVVAI